MRFLLVLAFGGILAAQALPGSVEGTVVNQLTGEPVRGVKLILKGSTGATFTAETGENGTYGLQGLEPGSYTLSAERAGFLTQSYGAKRSGQEGSVIRLMPEQKLTGIDLKLQPYGVIAGRVLDPDGDPSTRASVTVMKATYANGKKELRPAAIQARTPFLTNDLGEYRLYGLPPGDYYVRATSVGSEGAPINYAATYYPAATEIRRATALEITPGKVIAGIDVKLVRLPPVSVRGRVTSQTGAAGVVSVMLFPEVLGTSTGAAQVKADGQFEIKGVVPGRYWLLARLITGTGESYQAQHSVEVADQPIENVAIALDKGVSISGRVAVEPGGEPLGSMRSIRVSLRAVQGSALQAIFPTPSAQVGDDGNFRLDGVLKDQYELSLTGLPNGYYIKSARVGEVDLRESGLRVSDGAPGVLQIVLSGRAGKIDGTVKQSPGATVVVIPDGARRRARADWYRTATADQLGKFAIADVIPGAYKLFAWDDIEEGSWMDPEVLAALEARGTRVTIREGGSETLQIEAIQNKQK